MIAFTVLLIELLPTHEIFIHLLTISHHRFRVCLLWHGLFII